MRRVLAVVAVSLFVVLPASAASFLVNNLGDAPDALPGDGICATAGPPVVCTLRAAIMEADATAGIDSVTMMVAGTITPSTPLPAVTDRTFISATSAPGYATAPVVIVDGGGAIANGFEFSGGAGASQLNGFEVRGFTNAGVRLLIGAALAQNYIGPITGGIANGNGIVVESTATGAQIGSPGSGFQNVISGNGTAVSINGASGTWLMNNYIGTNPAGTAALPNGVGVAASSSSFTTIGWDATSFNLISGNSIDGVVLTGTTDVLVGGNRIGTDVTGLAALSNAGVGIRVGGSNTTLGDPAYRNIISGNGGTGVLVQGATQTTLQNNWIGVGVDGGTAIPNQWGIVEMGTGTVIGTVDSGNVISGNIIDGILLNPGTVNAQIVNNMIGTDAAGAAPIPNGQNGITADGSSGVVSSVVIGGSSLTQRNVISGNGANGIFGGFTSSNITGNMIGVNATGAAAVPNTINGIYLTTGNGINITLNTISGNTEDGVNLAEAVTAVVIASNQIGTDLYAVSAIPNLDSGIDVNSVANITIGNNVISGNTQAGADIRGTANGVAVSYNIIGRNATNSAAIPNGQEGVRIRDVASNISVDNNVIASNIAPFGAVLVTGNATATISTNSIFENGALGIDLLGDGVTANDALDADTGPNGLQNFPVLTSAVTSGTQSFITGTLNSTPSTAFRIEFFSSPAADPSGYGEGRTYLGFTNVTTDAGGNASFSFTGLALTIGQVITSTAMAATGTSEFSAVAVAAAIPTIQFSSATYSVGEGDATATITVTRSGDLTATSTVNYTTADSTATSGSDYTATSGVLTFAPGVASQTFTVPILEDTTDEPDETVTLTLSSPTIATLGAPSTATLTIVDNDGTPSISISDASQAEGDSGTAAMTFTVTLSNPSTSNVTVDYATSDVTATGGFDYGATVGTLTIPAGATTATITINIIGDTAFEPDETFNVNLSSPVNATISDAQGVGTIVNDDVAAVDLSVTKTAPASATAGTNIHYGIVAVNNGPDTATGVTVTDVLPAGMTLVSASSTRGTCSGTTTVTCSVGTLAAGEVAEITLTVATTPTAMTASNTATISANETDPNPANNGSTATTTMDAAAVVSVPTLSESMLLALALMLASLALFRMRA